MDCWKTIAPQFIESESDKFLCKLCINFESKTFYYATRHFAQAHGNHSVKIGDDFVFICKRGCIKRGHYHCLNCKKIFSRQQMLEKHVCSQQKEIDIETRSETGSVEVDVYEKNSVEIDNPANSESDEIDVLDHEISKSEEICKTEVKINCEHCDIKPMYRRNMKKHIERNHSCGNEIPTHLHKGVCVDRLNGIYLISENRNGIQFPVHVQKLLRGDSPKVYCDSSKCRVEKTIDGISGNPSFECSHLSSVSSITSNSEKILSEVVLRILVEEGRLEEDSARNLLLRQRRCQSDGINMVGAFTPELCNDRFVFLSVYGFGERRVIDRYIVTFDKRNFKLVCHCQHGGNCEHKSISKWFLRSEFPEVFSSKPNQQLTTSSLGIGFQKDVEYEFRQSRLNSDLRTASESFDFTVVTPNETKCCQNDCLGQLALHQSYENVKLLTRDGILIIPIVWNKICPKCHTQVNYNGVADGIFNFDNKFFMSLALLMWIRVGIRQHIAVSKTIGTIETLYDCHVDHNLVRRTFYKFLALFDEDKNFNCFVCGHHPVILTFDVTRKVAFKLKGTVEGDNKCEEVNAKDFWENLSKFIMTVNSDRSLKPSIGNWAPYIPPSSRRGDLLFNTEALKGVHGNDDQEFLECLSEERLEDILDIADGKMLKELCVECGIDASLAARSSRIKCIDMLIKAMKDHSSIDKFFCKPWHSSGGLLTGSCPHGIVYCLKFLLKPESARDYGDMILNFKHPPSIVISDIPHMVASHVNKRMQQDFFNPHCGRVVEPTERNILKAENNDLSVSINWLNKRSEAAIKGLKVDGTSIHPITLTTQRLSLYDNFHQSNTKQKKEFLRRTGQVKELAGVNSETAEQTNSFLKNSLSFVDLLSPVHHLLVVKAMLSQKNYEINKKILGKHKPIFDIYGRLINSMNSTAADADGSEESTSTDGLMKEIVVNEVLVKGEGLVNQRSENESLMNVDVAQEDILVDGTENLPDPGFSIRENIVNEPSSSISLDDLIHEEKKETFTLPSLRSVEPPTDNTSEEEMIEDNLDDVESISLELRKEKITKFLSKNLNSLVKIVLNPKNSGMKFSRESLFLFCYNDVEMDIVQEFLKKNCDQFELNQTNEYDLFAKGDLIMSIYDKCKGGDLEGEIGVDNDIKKKTKRKLEHIKGETDIDDISKKKKKFNSRSPCIGNSSILINLKHIYNLMIKNNDAEIRNIKIKFRVVLDNILENINHPQNYKDCKTDYLASNLIPQDVKNFHGKRMRALKTSGDGNCLFNALSIFLNKNEELAKLLRVLSAIELFSNPGFYANHPEVKMVSNLMEKDPEIIFPDIVNREAQNAYYLNGEKESAVLAEAKRICQNNQECSLVSVMALSSVLGFPIYSLYPENNYVHRCLFHQKIQPRIPFYTRLDCAYILWSRISMDERPSAWYIPNHFVPIIFD